MTQSFVFYDLETSGFNPREARVMQFAAQRTDMQLNHVGEPYNFFIKLTEDVLPDPDAVLITGITPQKTITEGLSEAEFLKLFHADIATPDTIFVGFNSVRFDDEFMRFLHYRNFYDAYEWQWQQGRSRWDLLDVVRMTRALRPDGIKWPVDSDGQPANRLTLLTAMNGLDHDNAHEALNDVLATIQLATLLRSKQPKLFDYLLTHRDKKSIAQLVEAGQPFVYTSGKYPSEFEKTTVAVSIAKHPTTQGVLVYDLRQDPNPFLKMTPEQLAEAWKYRPKEEQTIRLPVKTLKYNRCPAVAPLGVFDTTSQQRLKLPLNRVQANLKKLQSSDTFVGNILEALTLLDEQQQTAFLSDQAEVDAQLYDGFFDDADRKKMIQVHRASAQELTQLDPKFEDSRLNALWPLYKARNFPKGLSDAERGAWETFKYRKLLGGKTGSRAARYFDRLGELAKQSHLTGEQHYLLEELQLYGQSILPTEA